MMINTPNLENMKRLVILASANKRKELIEWAYANKKSLRRYLVISTARTAGLLEGTLNTPVVSLQHGRSGGYHQVREMIENGQADLLLVFEEPVGNIHRETPFSELIHAAVRHNLAVGYNRATIDALIAPAGPCQDKPADHLTAGQRAENAGSAVIPSLHHNTPHHEIH